MADRQRSDLKSALGPQLDAGRQTRIRHATPRLGKEVLDLDVRDDGYIPVHAV
jgi:hypothetical protein